MIIWKGLSAFNKEKIVVVATGIDRPSANVKTGEMIQLYILPEENLSLRANPSVCGSCKLQNNGCYVNLGQAANGIHKRLKKYTTATLKDIKEKFNKPARFGSYGEPVLIPIALVRKIVKACSGKITGYSHAWKEKRFQAYREFFMASVESVKEKEEANKLGWRTFRIVKNIEDILPTEAICPASDFYKKKTGKDGVTCSSCLLCRGNSIKARDIAIVVHGPKFKVDKLNKVLENNN